MIGAHNQHYIYRCFFLATSIEEQIHKSSCIFFISFVLLAKIKNFLKLINYNHQIFPTCNF